MNNSPEDTELIELLAKLLWHMDRRGYIQTDDPACENDVDNLRFMAQDAVRRARIRLGVLDEQQ